MAYEQKETFQAAGSLPALCDDWPCWPPTLGEAWRLAVGEELGDKIVSLMGTLSAAFANPLPSLHPFDLFIGLCCGAGMRLAVYLKGKNAKKYRHGMEYGSARWGNAEGHCPIYGSEKFEDNIILTKTERLMMSNRPSDPKNARNKNVLVVGGSGSGKTRLRPETESAAMQFQRFSGIIRGHRPER